MGRKGFNEFFRGPKMTTSQNALFWSPKLEGARFQQHALPLDLGKDLNVLGEILVSLAKQNFYDANPNVKSVPRDFNRIEVGIADIGQGSVIFDLVLITGSLLPAVYTDYFNAAKTTFTDTVRAVAEDRTPNVPQRFLQKILRFGGSLKQGERFLFPVDDSETPEYVEYDSVVRQKMIAASKVEVYEDAYVLRGEVVGTTRDKGLFTLKTASGESYSIRINDSISETVDKAESGFGWGGSPFRPKALVMITGEGTFRPDGTLKSVNTVDSMDPIDPLDPTVRLDELRNLKDEGHGKAPSSDGLDWLAEFFQDSYPADLPLPYLYPMEDGGISAEWEVGDKEIDVEIDLDNRRGTGIFYKDADEEFAVSFKDEASVKELLDRIRSLKGGDVNE